MGSKQGKEGFHLLVPSSLLLLHSGKPNYNRKVRGRKRKGIKHLKNTSSENTGFQGKVLKR